MHSDEIQLRIVFLWCPFSFPWRGLLHPSNVESSVGPHWIIPVFRYSSSILKLINSNSVDLTALVLFCNSAHLSHPSSLPMCERCTVHSDPYQALPSSRCSRHWLAFVWWRPCNEGDDEEIIDQAVCMKIRQERCIWSFYLNISIDLMVIGRVDAHLLRLLKGFNEKSDGAGSRFVLLSCHWLKIRITHSDAIYSM